MKHKKLVENIIEEAHSSITQTQRRLYPRNLGLHPKFIHGLETQIKLLQKAGMSDKMIAVKLQKAVPFHIYEKVSGEENAESVN